MKTQLRSTLFALACIFCFLATQAQPGTPSLQCGTGAISPEQARTLTKEAQLAFQLKKATGSLVNGINYVPIRPHILRRSNSYTGFSPERLNQVIAATNRYFIRNGVGIQFYFVGTTPDYIDNDDLYNSPTINEGVLANGRDATNALNQYYVESVGGPAGYAYYPFNSVQSTRSFISYNALDDYLGNKVIPHELGHTFNLIHTFGVSNTSLTTELVTRGTGANCTTDGDLLCDTPADPYNSPGVIYDTGSNSCPVYYPNSTARDANGQPYNPSMTNMMSYYPPCAPDFTSGQYQRMMDALMLRQTHTAYTLDAPPTNVTAPTNLTGMSSGFAIVLTWQDNAANEMGYFIERAVANSTNFVPIGGVGPDVTTFTDIDVASGNQYTYRIRPSNTTTGSLSQPITLTAEFPVIYGPTTTSITGTSALLLWNSLGEGVTYDVRYRLQGDSFWYNVLSIPNTRYFLNGPVAINGGMVGLATNSPYEWQVKSSASAVYSPLVSFTTTCPMPENPASYVSETSALLYWKWRWSQQYQTTTLQWRPQGSINWTTSVDIFTQQYSLIALTPSIKYEWRVRNNCPNFTPTTTDYTPIQSFTTGPSMYTIRSGVWNDPTVWSSGRTPVATDVVEIRHDMNLLSGSAATARQILYRPFKRLLISAGAQLMLTQ